jgi:amino acid/peptide:H+ symporter
VEGRPAERTLFGHPVGLANLFGVELWERFSFYGMLTILGYYLYYSVTDGGLELPKTTATGIVGAYGGLVYLSTVLGGWIADRLIGMERTVFYGGVVVMCGHLALAIVPGLAGVAAGLVLVALGSGALKANASSLLGTLYEKGDARCDGGFTLFYLGINLGAFIGPLITGLLQTRAGFHLWFRCCRSRHGTGPRTVRGVPAQPGHAWPHCAKPLAAQRDQLGSRDSRNRHRSNRGGISDRGWSSCPTFHRSPPASSWRRRWRISW